MYVQEELKQKYKPKTIACVRLLEPFRKHPELLKAAFEKLKRSPKQTECLLAFIQISKNQADITRKELCEYTNMGTYIVREIEKKGIFEIYKKEISRIQKYENELIDSFDLAPQQKRALDEIEENFKEKNVILLKGVTGSGKTRRRSI